MFSFRARAEKGIARHIDASSVVGTSNFWWLLIGSFWACACKLSWTLLSPARVQPLFGAGRKESSGTGLCIGGRGKGGNTSFLRVIAFIVPGLSENLFGRKLSFKLCETWYFWGVKLGYLNYIVFHYPTLAWPQKMYVAETWSWIKTRHLWRVFAFD